MGNADGHFVQDSKLRDSIGGEKSSPLQLFKSFPLKQLPLLQQHRPACEAGRANIRLE